MSFAVSDRATPPTASRHGKGELRSLSIELTRAAKRVRQGNLSRGFLLLPSHGDDALRST